MLCTTTRAKKIVVGLTLIALVTQAIHFVVGHLYGISIVDFGYGIMVHVIVPVTVLIINVIVVLEVRRRASSDAATNLGLQHHQSTSSNSAVPTAMLVTNSLVYVLFNCTTAILVIIWNSQSIAKVMNVVYTQPLYSIVSDLMRFIFAYNFYVYLITGKQFRSELHKLFCCHSSSSSSAAAAAVAVVYDDVRVAGHNRTDTTV